MRRGAGAVEGRGSALRRTAMRQTAPRRSGAMLAAAAVVAGLVASAGATAQSVPEHQPDLSAIPAPAPAPSGPGAGAADPASLPTPALIKRGATIYSRNCSPCHGARMLDPQGAFNLREFPHDQPDRFRNSVTRGKNQMPAWGDLLKPADIDALWAYVSGGERD